MEEGSSLIFSGGRKGGSILVLGKKKKISLSFPRKKGEMFGVGEKRRIIIIRRKKKREESLDSFKAENVLDFYGSQGRPPSPTEKDVLG